MLSGSTILRVVALLIVAAALAGIVQIYWAPAVTDGEPVATAEPARPARRIEPARPASPTSTSPSAPVPAPPAAVQAPAGIQAPAVVQAPQVTQTLPAMQAPMAVQAPVAVQAPAPAKPSTPAAPLSFEPSLATGEDDLARASDNAGPRAMAIVDLNTASVADLNGLKGGGMIGRAIVQKRPYTSVDQLLSKRVLSRSTYERIRDQVTVR